MVASPEAENTHVACLAAYFIRRCLLASRRGLVDVALAERLMAGWPVVGPAGRPVCMAERAE